MWVDVTLAVEWPSTGSVWFRSSTVWHIEASMGKTLNAKWLLVTLPSVSVCEWLLLMSNFWHQCMNVCANWSDDRTPLGPVLLEVSHHCPQVLLMVESLGPCKYINQGVWCRLAQFGKCHEITFLWIGAIQIKTVWVIEWTLTCWQAYIFFLTIFPEKSRGPHDPLTCRLGVSCSDAQWWFLRSSMALRQKKKLHFGTTFNVGFGVCQWYETEFLQPCPLKGWS